MTRRLLLCFVCIGVIGPSSCNDDNYEIPVCDGEPPGETYWDFSRMGIEIIDRAISTSSTTKCLNLADNRIKRIASNAFDGLPELRYLNLAGNPLVSNGVKSIPKLKTLLLNVLNQNSTEDNPETWFLPELEKLSLRYNATADYEYTDVFEVPKLTHLYLTGGCFSLTKLIANLTKINNLTDLYLDKTGIKTIRDVWAQNLRRLSMNGNEIRYLGMEPTFPYVMHNLEYLSVTDNQIVFIRSHIFDDFGKLRVLNLARNSISKLPSYSLPNTTSLKNLTLDDNRLSNVPEICALKKLQFLSLNGNRITSIEEGSFCNLTHLASIHLRKNGLTSIADEAFGHLPALATLDLSVNNIVFLPEHWISPRNFIRELNLEDNRFNDIQSVSLRTINGLETLRVGSKLFERMSVSSLMDLPNSTMIDTCWRP